MVKLEGFDFPDDMYFHKDHMWARVEGDKVRTGYNAWAAEAAGTLVLDQAVETTKNLCSMFPVRKCSLIPMNRA